jgi:hypothetical protein
MPDGLGGLSTTAQAKFAGALPTAPWHRAQPWAKEIAAPRWVGSPARFATARWAVGAGGGNATARRCVRPSARVEATRPQLIVVVAVAEARHPEEAEPMFADPDQLGVAARLRARLRQIGGRWGEGGAKGAFAITGGAVAHRARAGSGKAAAFQRARFAPPGSWPNPPGF